MRLFELKGGSAMARPANQVKPPSLALIIWANIIKWQMVRGVQDSEIAALLNVKNLTDRKRNKFITAEEMDTICSYLAIEPEKLLER